MGTPGTVAGMAALRAGAGYATVTCPAGVTADVRAGAPDLIVRALASPDHCGPGDPPDLEAAVADLLDLFDLETLLS